MRSVTRALAQAIPTARMREIEGAAHAVPLDAPREFAHVILDEIAALNPASKDARRQSDQPR
jgi:pimeloyl-ACP methyl ester carboxylesterase